MVAFSAREPVPEALDSQPADLRSRIVQAAIELFAERGYAATAMREVAERARCTKPALYYHFASKGALFLHALESETEGIAKLVEVALNHHGSVRERMQRAMEAYFDYVRARPTALRLLLRAEVHPDGDQPRFDFRSARQEYIEMMTQLIDAGVRSGELREGIDPVDAMHAIAGIADLRCMLWVLESEPIPDDYAARVLDLLFKGMGVCAS